jgi:hypothetical protein
MLEIPNFVTNIWTFSHFMFNIATSNELKKVKIKSLDSIQTALN